MLIRQIWYRICGTSLVEHLATQVADRSYPGVLNRITRQSRSMSVAEIRGYVRARCTRVVAEQLESVLAELPSKYRTLASQLELASTRRVVNRVTAELVAHPLPQPRQIRRAA